MSSNCSVSRVLFGFIIFFVIAIAIFLMWTFLPLNGSSQPSVDPMSVTFQLFTRSNPTEPQILKLGNLTLLQKSNFKKNLPVKIYAHEWGGKPDAVLTFNLAKNWLEKEDCNIISVDWSILATGGSDDHAVRNVSIAGATTGAFINFLIEHGTPYCAFHLVGLGMGAHVAGNAGAAVKQSKVPRITGLDPTSAGFPLRLTDNRLDKSDAHFVDVIHTQTAFLDQMGHADFYPICGLADKTSHGCSSARALDLYAESITSSIGFHSLECTSYSKFRNGTCDGNPEAEMGEHASNTARGTFYLLTNVSPPFARGRTKQQ